MLPTVKKKSADRAVFQKSDWDTSWIQADTSGYIADTRDTKTFLSIGINKSRKNKVCDNLL
jgi:hypothetical protein